MGLPFAIFLGFRNTTAYDRYWKGASWGRVGIAHAQPVAPNA